MTRGLPPILAEIRATKEAEIAALLGRRSLGDLRSEAEARTASDPPRPFESALAAPCDGVPHVIAEVKKASPSKGVIREDFDPPALARAYARGGAAAISCLTDATYFRGALPYLDAVRDASGLPVLRKDFLLHPAQLYESRAGGADGVLLIARMLDPARLADLYALARDLGMGVLLEVHDEPDLERALAVGPSLLGVNNRDLDTFVVDMETTFRLRARMPAGVTVVAESGIDSHDRMTALAGAGVHAVLVGEHLMRQTDVARALRTLRGASV